MRRERLLDLAEAVAAAGAEVAEAPAAGTVMVRLRGPVGEFCLTEVVVTTATAVVAGRRAWACVLGWDEEGALACALLAADASPEASALAAEALRAEAADREARLQAVGATRVGEP